MIEVEGYRNYHGELRVGFSRGGKDHYFTIATREEATKLRDALSEILQATDGQTETPCSK